MARPYLMPLLAVIGFIAVAIPILTCGDAEDEVVFAQITDVHLFDEGKPRKANTPPDGGWWKNEQTLDWAIAAISKLEGLRFVVFTGDLGLEMAGPGIEAEAVERLAKHLERLPVRSIFFVPGNNDLLNEDHVDNGRYQHFIAELQKRLKPREVVDLTRARQTEIREFNGVVLHGLDSSTFKNSLSCLISFKEAPAGNPAGANNFWIMPVSKQPAPGSSPGEQVKTIWCKKGDIDARAKFQAEEMQRLQKEIEDIDGPRAKKGQSAMRHVVFTHIPPMDDPFPNVKTEDEVGEDGKPLGRFPPELEPTPDVRKQWAQKKGPLPWNLHTSALTTWLDGISANSNVVCLFAGHLHNADRAWYGVTGVANGVEKTCSRQIVVAPPLAIKRQEGGATEHARARGYLVGRFRPAGGVTYRIEFAGPGSF